MSLNQYLNKRNLSPPGFCLIDISTYWSVYSCLMSVVLDGQGAPYCLLIPVNDSTVWPVSPASSRCSIQSRRTWKKVAHINTFPLVNKKFLKTKVANDCCVIAWNCQFYSSINLFLHFKVLNVKPWSKSTLYVKYQLSTYIFTDAVELFFILCISVL